MNAYLAYVLAAIVAFACAMLMDVVRCVLWEIVRRIKV